MPNHVYNRMYVDFTDTPTECRTILGLALEKTADGEIDSFIRHFIPFPKEGQRDIVVDGVVVGTAFESFDSEAGTIDGYQWAIDNWGSKWGDYDFKRAHDHTYWKADYGELNIDRVRIVADDLCEFAYEFTSAWCPPEQGLQTISEKYQCRITVLSIMEAPEWRYHGVWDRGEVIVDSTEDLCPEMPDEGEVLRDDQKEDLYHCFWENAFSVVEAMCGDRKRLVPEWEISLESLKKVTIHDVKTGAFAS